MPETVKKDEEAEDFSMKDLEDRAERNLESFKDAVDQYFSEK